MKLKFTFYLLLFGFISGFWSTETVFAADISIPEMELITRANFSAPVPEITSRGKVLLDLSGGYKFSGNLALGFDSSDLSYSSADINSYTSSAANLADYLSHQTYISFQSAQVTLRDIFSKTSSFSYFIGKTDTFCSGDIFPDFFGTYPVATLYRGYTYFPSNDFNGIYRVNGTGFKLATTWGTKTNQTSFYLYKDGYLSGNYLSGDIWSVFNFKSLKLESFFGATFPNGLYGIYRGGVLLNYKAGDVGDFMAQIGVPMWDPNAAFDINRLFFLFEPRIHFNLFSLILTLFWHPGYYLQQKAIDTGTSNVHLNFMLGDLTKTPFAGGVEGTVTFNSSSSTNQFSIVATPYLSAITSGSILNLMLNINLFPFTLTNMFEGVIGIKAAF